MKRRTRIEELPKDAKVTKEEMKQIIGGSAPGWMQPDSKFIDSGRALPDGPVLASPDFTPTALIANSYYRPTKLGVEI